MTSRLNPPNSDDNDHESFNPSRERANLSVDSVTGQPHTRTTFDWESVRRRFQDLCNQSDDGESLTPEQSEQILRRRAEVLAKAPDTTDDANVTELMVLNIGSEKIALETRFIHEVVRASDITPVPGAPPLLIGVTNLRGSVLPVMEFALVFQLGADSREDAMLVVIGGEQPEFGVLVDAVHDVVALQTDHLLPPPANVTGLQRDLCKGVTREALLILDGDSLISHPHFFIGDGGAETEGGPV